MKQRQIKTSTYQTSRFSGPTIGFLIADMTKSWELLQWQGAMDAALEREANLLCFAGGKLSYPQKVTDQANVLYELIDPEQIDGLVISSGLLKQPIQPQVTRHLTDRYHSLPIVSIGLTMDGIPNVLTDDYHGMREAIVHLIEVHGFRHLAFARGPEDHPGMQKRYQAYTDVLAEYDLPSPPDLVIPMDDRDRGEAMVAHVLDERKMVLQRDIEAVVAASDGLALTLIKAFQKRGIQIPNQAAILGFGNREEGKIITPPLTTVQPPFYDMGFQAVDMMLAQLRGEPISPQETLPMKLIVRQSCGCLEPIVVEAAAEVTEKADESYETVFTERRESLIADILHVVQDHNENLKRGWITQLLDAFSTEIATETSQVFLSALEDILHQVAMAGGDVSSWQGAISVLRRYALPCFDTGQLLRRAENLWGQARILINGVTQQVEESQRLQAERQAQILSEIGQELITTFDQEELRQVLLRELPLLGIPGCYLALYEDPDNPVSQAQMTLIYNTDGCLDVEPEELRFPSSRLVPDVVTFEDRHVQAVIEPLYFREQQIGFVIFEAGSREGDIYETLRAQISGALKGAQLLQQHVQAQDILALQPVMQQVVSVGEQLGNASNQLLEISEHMAAGAEETSRQASLVSSNSQQIQQIIHEVSSATEKEGAGVQKISDSVTQVTGIVATALEIAQAANAIMVNLKTYSQQIGEIIKTITGIAKRTKFLSLYAAIEAAKAGDFGQGFAVVASEVKKLAQETSDSAKDIAAKLEVIQHSGQDAAAAINSVVEIVSQVSELSQIIATAVIKQTETTNEIASEMGNAVDGTDEITRAMRDVATAAQDSAKRAGQVQHAAQELSALAVQLRRLVEEVHM